jgi:cytoskeletal protein RodZ
MTLIDAANNFGDTSQEGASAGPMALAVVALLAVATILLWRNMTARIKRLPASFPDPAAPQSPPSAQSPSAQSSAASDANSANSVKSTAETDADPKADS